MAYPGPSPPLGTSTDEEATAEKADYTIFELIEIALNTPEMGSVRFETLRLSLLAILEETGTKNTTADMDEEDEKEIKSYIAESKGLVDALELKKRDEEAADGNAADADVLTVPVPSASLLAVQ